MLHILNVEYVDVLILFLRKKIKLTQTVSVEYNRRLL